MTFLELYKTRQNVRKAMKKIKMDPRKSDEYHSLKDQEIELTKTMSDIIRKERAEKYAKQ